MFIFFDKKSLIAVIQKRSPNFDCAQKDHEKLLTFRKLCICNQYSPLLLALLLEELPRLPKILLIDFDKLILFESFRLNGS